MTYFLMKRALLCFLLFVPFLAWQAKANTDTLRINIQDAEVLLLQRNLDLLAANFHVSAKEAMLRNAHKWNNPTLLLDQNIYNQHAKTWFPLPPGGQTYVQVQQLIRLANKHSKEIAIAADDNKIAELQLDDLLRNLRLTLHTDLYRMAALQKKLGLFQVQIQKLDQVNLAMQSAFEKGLLSQKENLRIKASLFQLRQEALVNEQERMQLQAELQSILALPATMNIVSTESTDIQADNSLLQNFAQLPVNTLLDSALHSRPDYLVKQMSSTMQEHTLALEKANRVPDVLMGLEYDYNSNYIPRYWGATLSMPLPVFNTGKQRVQAQSAELKSVQQLTASYAKQVAAEVNQNVKVLNTDAELLSQVQKDFGSNYDLLFNSVMSSYQNREISFLEFIDFFDTYRNTKGQQIDLGAQVLIDITKLNSSVATNIIKK